LAAADLDESHDGRDQDDRDDDADNQVLHEAVVSQKSAIERY
jgi:hypothetical protein